MQVIASTYHPVQPTPSPVTARGWKMDCSFAHQFDVPLFIGRVSPEYFAITSEVPLVCYLNQEGRQAIIITGFDHHSFLATELAMAKLFPAFLRLTATKSADRSLFSASAHYTCNVMSGHGYCLLCHSVKHYEAMVRNKSPYNCTCFIFLFAVIRYWSRLQVLFFCIYFFGFFLSSFLDFTAASQQRKDILTCELPYGFISVHIIKLCFVFSFGKISANRLKCQIDLLNSKDSLNFLDKYIEDYNETF